MEGRDITGGGGRCELRHQFSMLYGILNREVNTKHDFLNIRHQGLSIISPPRLSFLGFYYQLAKNFMHQLVEKRVF